MTNEKRNTAIMDKIERYTQHHTATPDLAQEAIERRITMNNGKDSAVPIMKIQSPETFKDLFRINIDGTVTGDIENASEAAKVFFESFRDLIQRNIRQPTQSDALREKINDIKEAWDWWQVDTYDRCASVVEDAINAALKESK
jgi:hypothetical protein